MCMKFVWHNVYETNWQLEVNGRKVFSFPITDANIYSIFITFLCFANKKIVAKRV